MRKIFACIVAAIMVFGAVSSINAQSKTAIGFKAGLNMANIIGDDADQFDDAGLDKSMRMGMIASGLIEIQFSDILAGQIELGYAQKGFRLEGSMTESGIDIDLEADVKLDYLEIPLLVKISLPMNAPIKPFLCVGPQIGILLLAESKAKASAMGESESNTTDMKDDTKSIDLGLALGAGIAIPAGNGAVIIDARYTFGLSTFDATDDEADLKNSVIGITAGYQFGL